MGAGGGGFFAAFSKNGQTPGFVPYGTPEEKIFA
jgi:hypothetical protein